MPATKSLKKAQRQTTKLSASSTTAGKKSPDLANGNSTNAGSAIASCGRDSTSKTTESKVKCAVCTQVIVDGKDEALFCEGACGAWFHRYCAGVPLAYFQQLSLSSKPYICVCCFQTSYNEELLGLKSTVKTLQEEIVQLRSALEAKEKQHHVKISDTNAAFSSKDQGHQIRHTAGRDGRGQTRRGRGRRGSLARDSNRECISGGIVGEDIRTSSDCKEEKPLNKVRVDGARRVWGTMQVTTSSSLHSVITKLSTVKNESLKIKRKTIVNGAGQVTRWWFVIHAPESILKALDSEWIAIQLQTGWKLESCFKPVHASDATKPSGYSCDVPSLSTTSEDTILADNTTRDDDVVHNAMATPFLEAEDAVQATQDNDVVNNTTATPFLEV